MAELPGVGVHDLIVVLFGCFADTQLALVMGALWCLFLLGYYRLVVVRARTEA